MSKGKFSHFMKIRTIWNFPISFFWIEGTDYPVPKRRWKEVLLNFQL